MGRNVAPRHQAASGERDVWSSSQRRKRRGGKRGRRWPGILLVTGILLAVAVPWAMRPENLRPQKDQLLAFLYQQGHQEGYNAQALLLTDLSNGEAFHSKNQEAPLLPASLAKLFVVEYASTLVGPEERGTVTSEALGLVLPKSWRPTACTPWGTWPGAPLGNRVISTMRICCTSCSALTRSC